jgi:hypothetical protein
MRYPVVEATTLFTYYFYTCIHKTEAWIKMEKQTNKQKNQNPENQPE